MKKAPILTEVEAMAVIDKMNMSDKDKEAFRKQWQENWHNARALVGFLSLRQNSQRRA